MHTNRNYTCILPPVSPAAHSTHFPSTTADCKPQDVAMHGDQYLPLQVVSWLSKQYRYVYQWQVIVLAKLSVRIEIVHRDSYLYVFRDVPPLH